MPSEYLAEGSALYKQRAVDAEHRIVFRADKIRQERTGVHALVQIEAAGHDARSSILAWSNFNVERDEDRVRLANSAFKHLNGLSATYTSNFLKNDLDQFCSGLWDATLGMSAPEEVCGSSVRRSPAFMLYPFVLQEAGTIVFAPPGRGKSYALLLMAVSVDAGLGRLWTPVTQRKVLFINLERGKESVADRLGNVNAALGLPRERPLAMINRRGRSLTDVASAAQRYINEHDVGLVCLDSLSRAGSGDLNGNQEVNRTVDILNGFGVSWVALGHTPRNDESHVYGSVMFEAAADIVVQLLSEQEEEGPLGLGLQMVKDNDVGKVPMWTMALEFDDMGLSRVRHARPGEFPEVEKGRKLTPREMIREHLMSLNGDATATEVAEDLGLDRANISALMNRDEWFVKTRKVGRNQYYGLAG